MSMKTNLQGRLRNTSLPYNHGLLPLYEAVVNSIHAIEEAKRPSGKGQITVEIIRDTQQDLEFRRSDKKRGPDACKEITGFKIIDNGVGFNESNMASFRELDSEYKANKGGRGIGRLLWLKAFSRVTVDSVFRDEKGTVKSRQFGFTSAQGVSDLTEPAISTEKTMQTCVFLDGFEKRYRESSRKTTRAIANSLFEHCLWYFVREGGAPSIVVRDEDERIALDDVYEDHMVSSSEVDQVEIKGNKFDITHIKLRANSSHSHVVAFCAANRLVKEEGISGKVPGLYGKLQDDSGEFVYAGYVTSPFLDDAVRAERTEFDIAENASELFAPTETSFTEIRDAVLAKTADHLADYLKENREKSRARLESFVSLKAPRYRPIMGRIPEDDLVVDPTISDRELDLALHKHLSQIEEELLSTGHDIMEPKESEGLGEYKKRLQNYLRTAEDIKKSDLANYVSHRRVILDLLEKAIERDETGKYKREELIHTLLMPMKKDSSELEFEGFNLWLLDERLAFHDYLASDKPIASMPITNSDDRKEPDILSLYVVDNPMLVSEEERPPFASLTIVELKRPMRDDVKEGEEKDPIEQSLGYLQRIREGRVQTKKGRPLGNSQDIPGYCYVVCDLSRTMVNRCKMHDLTITSDGLGYFGYKANYKAYIEVVSFDRLVNSAKQRNRAFFDKLGLPTR